MKDTCLAQAFEYLTCASLSRCSAVECQVPSRHSLGTRCPPESWRPATASCVPDCMVPEPQTAGMLPDAGLAPESLPRASLSFWMRLGAPG